MPSNIYYFLEIIKSVTFFKFFKSPYFKQWIIDNLFNDMDFTDGFLVYIDEIFYCLVIIVVTISILLYKLTKANSFISKLLQKIKDKLMWSSIFRSNI